MFSDLFRAVFARKSRITGRSGATSRGRPAPRTRLALERLDERDVPATFVVTNSLNAGPGSLRQAILDANANPNSGLNDVVQINVNMINLTDALPDVNDGVDIVGLPGAGGGTRLMRMSSAQFRFFTIYPNGETFTLSNLLLYNGYSSGDGGGIWSKGTLTLDNCSIQNCYAAGVGGAVCQMDADLTLHSTTVQHNAAGTNGGGVFFNSGGAQTLGVDGCVFTDNNAGQNGGGIYFYALGTLTSTGSSYYGNHANNGRGGGICADLAAFFTVTGGTITVNTAATSGGAIYVYADYIYVDATVNNNVAEANRQTDNGLFVRFTPGSFIYIGPGVSPPYVIV